MPTLETYKKQAKQLLRWHREGNYSIGGRIRQLPRYRNLTDRDALALAFKLTEAQEIIALEAGYDSWAALKAAVDTAPRLPDEADPVLLGAARPVLLVRNVQTAAEFYRDRLGFRVDFLHGHPPFYWLGIARRRHVTPTVRARARVRPGRRTRGSAHHGLHRSPERQGAIRGLPRIGRYSGGDAMDSKICSA